ncbi:MAG: hypothetical protein V3U84_07305, partial [Thiotrichaceae bacterium]
CSENDLIERASQANAAQWYSFLDKVIREKGAILLTGKDGHVLHVLQQLASDTDNKFYLLAINIGASSPLIYVSTESPQNISRLDDLIGIFPFNDSMHEVPACSFECVPSQTYNFGDRCLSPRIAGIVKKYSWKYPSAPLSTDFIACSENTYPPFPQIIRGEKTMNLPYSKKTFYSDLSKCWSSQNIDADTSGLKYADIQIEATIQVFSASNSAVQRLPKNLLNELKSGIGINDNPYPISAERRLLITFEGCD